MTPILSTQSLTKNFASGPALTQVSLSLEEGDIYGLIGQNGAGKTTLLKLITRLIHPTSGTLSLFGSSSDREWSQALARVGAVIESPAAFPNLSAYENLRYQATLLCLPQAEQVIQETLELIDLQNAGRKPFKDFSLGMKQRLAIGLAILAKPDLLILDEPVNGLDPIGISDLRALLLRLNRELGMTMMISSHILSELQQVANRFGFIKDGRLIKEISKTEFDRLSEDYIVLKTHAVEAASRLLESQFSYPFKVVDETGEIHVFAPANQLSAVNTALVQGQVALDEIYYAKQNLENYFTQLIHEEDAHHVSHS